MNDGEFPSLIQRDFPFGQEIEGPLRYDSASGRRSGRPGSSWGGGRIVKDQSHRQRSPDPFQDPPGDFSTLSPETRNKIR